jgi:hypothetical protein
MATEEAMTARDLPGYGDSTTWGPVASPRDPRYDDRADIAEAELIAIIAEHVLDERMKSATCIEDAFSELTHEDYNLMAASIASGAPTLAGMTLRASVERIIRADAQKEARSRLERLRDEAEADAAAERMED